MTQIKDEIKLTKNGNDTATGVAFKYKGERKLNKSEVDELDKVVKDWSKEKFGENIFDSRKIKDEAMTNKEFMDEVKRIAESYGFEASVNATYSGLVCTFDDVNGQRMQIVSSMPKIGRGKNMRYTINLDNFIEQINRQLEMNRAMSADDRLKSFGRQRYAEWFKLFEPLANELKSLAQQGLASISDSQKNNKDMKRVKDNLDEDMQLWNERRNDKFGQVLDEIEQYTIDLFGTEKNEYGIDDSILGWLPSEYALDGNRKYVAKQVYNILYQYDMIDNMDDPHFMELVNEMMELAGLNTVSDSEKVKDGFWSQVDTESFKKELSAALRAVGNGVRQGEGGLQFTFDALDSALESIGYKYEREFRPLGEDVGFEYSNGSQTLKFFLRMANRNERQTFYYMPIHGGLDIHDSKPSISDSKKIKDAEDVVPLDGLLMVAFKDGQEEDGLKAIQGHANESGELEGVKYETYNVDEQDGVAVVDMCAVTNDANAFVKVLLKEWGVIDAVADLDFKKSDEMQNAEEQVSDSKVSDMTKPVHFRGYAEKARAKRRQQKEAYKENQEEENQEEEEKQDVSDSCRIKDDANDIILHFHVGRGGRFYNQGFMTYEGEESLSDFVAHNGQDIFVDNDGYYMDGAGNSLGDAKEGDEVGVLDFDGEYDTDYFVYMSEIEIDDRWYDAIMKAIKNGGYVEHEVEEYVNSLEY